MSIINEIQRLQQAKQDLKDKLLEKGVDVGDKKLDEYAPMLDEIQSGGGSSGDLTPVEQFLLDNAKLVNISSGAPINTYETDEETVLYTISQEYKYYFITQRDTGQYRILWSKIPILTYQNSFKIAALDYANANITITAKYKFSKLNDVEPISEPSLSYTSSGYVPRGFKGGEVCYSSNYSSINDCINAIKNNNTMYTLIDSGSSITCSPYSNNTAVILTNSYCIGTDGKINAIGRQISSNEKILVID